MPNVRVTLTKAAAEEFDELPLTMKLRVLRVLERLEHWPEVSGSKALRGVLSGQYRIRTGNWRVRFTVRDGSLVVLHIGHRDGHYESS